MYQASVAANCAQTLAVLKSQYPVSTDPVRIRLVDDVCEKLLKHTADYFEEIGRKEEFTQYAWSVHLLESPELNALCMPDGTIVVFSGMLNVASGPDEIAVVLAHEIAHALCRHSAEREADRFSAQIAGGVAVGMLQQSSGGYSRADAAAVDALGLLLKYGFLLPHSREHESEADHLGLILMSVAGFNPEEAPKFWVKFHNSAPPGLPSFLTTHPNPLERAAFLRAMLPTVKPIHEKAKELGR